MLDEGLRQLVGARRVSRGKSGLLARFDVSLRKMS